MSLLINIAAQFSGKKALKEAQKQVNVLESSVKKLGATLGLSLSTAAVVAFGKASVKAFMDDEKAAAILSNTVKNLGLSFADANIKTFIDQLAIASGVVDDELRPAMQRLLQATKSLSMSQDLLKQSIDFARGSGQSLETVILDISNAYVGNNKGLKKYTLGLSAAQLKTASFDDVLKAFNKNFTGANAAYLKTYAGQMGVLTVAAAEAKEVIGKGLVDSLVLLSDDNSVQGLADSMKELADNTSNAIYGFSTLIGELKKTGAAAPSWLSSIGNFLVGQSLIGQFGKIAKVGEVERNKKMTNPSVQMFMTDINNMRLNNEKLKVDKKILDATKKNTAELKKQAASKKQNALFDLDIIQRMAALQGKITEEEKLRLNLQLALLTGNDKLAADLAGKLADTIDSTGKLKLWLTTLPDANNPFKGWDSWLTDFTARMKATLALTAPGGSSQRDITSLTPTVSALVTGAVTGGAGSTAAGDVYITVNGSVLSEQDLVSAVQNGLNYNALAGKRSDIGRISGMFG